MTQTDVLYRSFGELFKGLCADTSTKKIIEAIAKSPDAESITVTHKVCCVETDWISAIEKGLIFIGKAIEENRQFIRSDGEVKPIEKVKHISKESVQHLSRHSDLITREQQADNIVPDKLYTVEKDSDYAVYENKFLYLLLTRIRDFVGERYNAIVNAYKEYKGEYSVKKTVKTSSRRLNFTFTFSDEQDDAVFAPADEECLDAIGRMNNIMQSVAFYLRTPLMQEVSHADKLTSVTKTNVLLKNKNFFGALKLYEYLLTYDKEGYSIEGRVDRPELTEDMMKELAVPALLSAFLVYEHGLGLEKYLQGEFEKEELRRADEEQKELLRKLSALKKRIERTGESAEHYILMLEQRNAIIENSYALLQDALERIEEFKAQIASLKSEIELLEQDIKKLEDEKQSLIDEMARKEAEYLRKLDELDRRHKEEIAALNAAHESELAAVKQQAQEQYAALKRQTEDQLTRLRDEHKEEINRLRAANEAELAAVRQRAQDHYALLKKQSDEQISRLKEAHKADTERLTAANSSRLEALKADYEHRLELLRADYEKRIADGESRIKDSRDRIGESEAKAQSAFERLSKIQNELKYTAAERDVLSARLTALRKEYGLLTEADDFTTEAGFNALEHEFEVLGRLLNDEWKNVRTMLRKEFSAGLRATMRKKKPVKSKEYLELQQFALSQREDVADAKNGDAAKPGEAEDKGDNEVCYAETENENGHSEGVGGADENLSGFEVGGNNEVASGDSADMVANEDKTGMVVGGDSADMVDGGEGDPADRVQIEKRLADMR